MSYRRVAIRFHFSNRKRNKLQLEDRPKLAKSMISLLIIAGEVYNISILFFFETLVYDFRTKSTHGARRIYCVYIFLWFLSPSLTWFFVFHRSITRVNVYVRENHMNRLPLYSYFWLVSYSARHDIHTIPPEKNKQQKDFQYLQTQDSVSLSLTTFSNSIFHNISTHFEFSTKHHMCVRVDEKNFFSTTHCCFIIIRLRISVLHIEHMIFMILLEKWKQNNIAIKLSESMNWNFSSFRFRFRACFSLTHHSICPEGN